MFTQSPDEEFEDEEFEQEEGPDNEVEAELAEDSAHGLCCSECGQYFEQAHGHPVLCASCWETASEADRKGLQEATFAEIK